MNYSEMVKQGFELSNIPKRSLAKNERRLVAYLHATEDFILSGAARAQRSTALLCYANVWRTLLEIPAAQRTIDLAR